MAGTVNNLFFGSVFLFEGYWLLAIILFLIGFMFVTYAVGEATKA